VACLERYLRLQTASQTRPKNFSWKHAKLRALPTIHASRLPCVRFGAGATCRSESPDPSIFLYIEIDGKKKGGASVTRAYLVGHALSSIL
jgi:hypothetical protein